MNVHKLSVRAVKDSPSSTYKKTSQPQVSFPSSKLALPPQPTPLPTTPHLNQKQKYEPRISLERL